MQIFVKSDLVRALPERWKASSITENGRWRRDRDHNIYEQLLKARDNDEPFDGLVHESWITLGCEVCEENVEVCASFLVSVAGEEDTLQICPACLLAAAQKCQDAIKSSDKSAP